MQTEYNNHMQTEYNNHMQTEYTIRLTKGGNYVDGLTIEGGFNGERDKQHNLIEEGGVLFLTPAGKKFFCKYSQFSFVVNKAA